MKKQDLNKLLECRNCKILDKQNCNVIVAALYSHPRLLSRNRKLFKNYFEIYLKANIEFLLGRELKIYHQALKKKIKNVLVLILNGMNQSCQI